MGPAGFPAKGAQTRRKADGMLGEICANDSLHNLLSVRWPTIPGDYATKDYSTEQFAREWELTGAQLVEERPLALAPPLIGLVALMFLVFVIMRGNLSPYKGYDAYKPLATDTATTLNSPRMLNQKYGLLAADMCNDGADNYLRSVAHYKYNWDGAGTPTERFDRFNPVLTAPGELTMISDKARVSDGFGVFQPIEVFCNFDTQNREVLSYGSLPEDQ